MVSSISVAKLHPHNVIVFDVMNVVAGKNVQMSRLHEDYEFGRFECYVVSCMDLNVKLVFGLNERLFR